MRTDQLEPLPAFDSFGLCECGEKFPDVSDAARRLRTNIEVQDQDYITVRRDDVETILGFADRKPNA